MKAPNREELDNMVAEATVDCYNDSERITAFNTMLEEHLETPFMTSLLGVDVTVTRVDLTLDERIVAICGRGKARQSIPILDLPLPTPPPEGAGWIAAYRHWVR